MEERRRDLSGTHPLSASPADAPPPEQATSRRRGGGHKRKSTSLNSGGGGSSNSQASSSKRQAREKPPAVPLLPIYMNGPLTRARLQPFNSNSVADVAPLKNEVEAREAAASARAEEISRAAENWEALEANIEAEYEAIKSRDVNVHVVPAHAGWFSWIKIHPLEERMLPSFFNGTSKSKSPKIYMEIRNWILKKFHLNPCEQVELKHLSELTSGEMDARQEVMEFLEYWGLINYHPFTDQEPSYSAAASTDADKDEDAKANPLVEKLFKFETVQSCAQVVPRASTTIPTTSSGLIPESTVADELLKSKGPAVEYHCNSCSGDCSRKRYHCQKQADFDLCADCFNSGEFGSHMSPSDFILMEPAEAAGASGGKWTDQETLLLLEAIELFRDNWSEIAEHVATKTRAQCILHFVQMPIEDAFFNHGDEVSDAPNSNENEPNSENSAPKADKESDTASKDIHEDTEIEGCDTDIRDSSCAMKISKPDEAGESDGKIDVGENFVLKALKEAFEAVGSRPSPGEKMSFAEAGNPVMTLAAFLVRLMDPNIVNVSVHNHLKFVSKNHSGEELAARHCFPLEDPPDYKKNLGNLEGAETETSDCEAQKNDAKNTELQKETLDSNSICVRDEEHNNTKDSDAPEHDENKNSASKDQKPEASPSREPKTETSKGPDKVTSKVQSSSGIQPRRYALRRERAGTEFQSSTAKESEGGASAQDMTQSKSPLKEVDMTQSKSPLKEVDMTSLPEKKEPDLTVLSNSITDKEKSGDEEGKEYTIERKGPIAPKIGLDYNKKLSRAALAAISAAAIKAKFLADQEENQILQLSTFLIEKQLYKLETKLAFFNDMETIVMRVKDLLERSKQKLFHERAQIIATRFGAQASTRPPNSQALLPNRAAVNFPTTRPIMAMNVFRPPISKPMMIPVNPNSSVIMTGSPTGSVVQPNAADRLSSVGMK